MSNKLWMKSAIFVTALALGCACAFGDSISLSQDSGAGFAFSSTSPASSSLTINLFGNLSSSAVLTTGTKPVLGSFSIFEPKWGKPLTMSLAHPPSVNPNLWWISGGPLIFRFKAGGNTLWGRLHLVDLAQAPGDGLTANLNDALAVNLTHLKGSLASDFDPGAVMNLTLDFPTSERLACLLGPATTAAYPDCPAAGLSSITADFDHGSVDPAPTPEPASLSLFGLGLFGLAFICRRRLKAMAR